MRSLKITAVNLRNQKEAVKEEKRLSYDIFSAFGGELDPRGRDELEAFPEYPREKRVRLRCVSETLRKTNRITNG
jgi:hypothetical protein